LPSPGERCVVIGAGPAGLTAAWELCKLGIPAVVFEADSQVGGIARTASYKGYGFDIGGHRFFTKVDLVKDIWHEILGDELLTRPRLSRIYYDDKFFDYPLRPMNALMGLGPVEAVRIGLSYVKAQVMPEPEERNLEQWVSNRFGRRLYEIFFKTYTEKVWGMRCTEIGADWAAQRIKNLNLATAVKNALLGQSKRGGEVVTTLIDEFEYPRRGPGMMWERCEGLLAARGYPTHLLTPVVRLHHDFRRATAVTVRDASGRERREEGAWFLPSMALKDLIHACDPLPPEDVVAAADRLRYRDFLTVVLIVKQPELFPDNWLYIHSPRVRLGRIQNFKNWSPDMVPDPAMSSLGLEYFVQEGDDLWTMGDDDLVELGRRECAAIGLVREADVVDGCVVRVKKAYPVYDGGYKAAVDTVRGFLETLANVQPIGRNGQHRYNNQDHSMVTAVYAARNIAGAAHDVWNVNVDAEYHEEVKAKPAAPLERAVPAAAKAEVEESYIREAFARYDPVALGAAVGALLGCGLFAATAVLLVKGGEFVGPNLSLLANYFKWYRVSWPGALVGFAEASLGGFALGFIIATAINGVTGLHELAFRRRLEMARTMDLFEERTP
jgi:protoporphyrinogen oxidase